jgi:hypothetical protein
MPTGRRWSAIACGGEAAGHPNKRLLAGRFFHLKHGRDAGLPHYIAAATRVTISARRANEPANR